jgi:hypothetical protein
MSVLYRRQKNRKFAVNSLRIVALFLVADLQKGGEIEEQVQGSTR